MDMDGGAVSIRLRRSTPSHDAYTVRVFDRRFAALATARPADARRWVATTRWLHGGFLHQGRLLVGLGVQWTPTGQRQRPLLHGGALVPRPATLQLCVGHRCLVFHLAHHDADAAVPEMLRRFLADPRVTFVASGGAGHDCRMLWAHYGLHVARWRELRAVAGMGHHASLQDMADRFLGYPGIYKPRDVAMSDWDAPRLSPDQVQYASVDAYLAFRLAIILCPAAAVPPRQPVPPPAQQRAPAAHVRQPPLIQQRRAPAVVRPAPPARRAPAVVRQAPPVQRAPAVVRPAPPAQRAPVVVECSPRAFSGVPVPVPAVGAYSDTSKLMNTRAGLFESDTDSDTDFDYGDVGGTGLPIRVYASDSDDIVDSSDGFEHVGLGASTDDEEDEDDDEEDEDDDDEKDEDDDGEEEEDDDGEEEEDDGDEEEEDDDEKDEDGDEEDEDDDYVSYNGTGSLGADGVDSNVDDQEDGEGCNGDDQDDEDHCNGDDQDDEDGCNGDDQDAEDGCNGDDQDAEHGCNGDDQDDEDGCNGDDLEDDALAQDDWYDQEVDYGCDQDVEAEFDEEFYLL